MQRRKVEDVMTKDVITVSEETPFAEIVDALAEHAIKSVPVVDQERRVRGIVTDADLLRKQEYKDLDGELRPLFERWRHRRAHDKAEATDARGLMSTPAVTLSPDMTVAEAARLLAKHHFKQTPVVDEDGRLLGIVARPDLLRVFQRSDEDIREEVVREVIVRYLWQDPSLVTVRVHEGVVALTGRIELRSLAPIAVRLTAATEGVVDVIDELAYDRDDTHPTTYPRA